jgi:DNA topoisomerase-1
VIEDRDGERRERRGRVVVVAKPDGTVLVHDCDGYQPVAWLTRADAVTWTPTDRSVGDHQGDGVASARAEVRSGDDFALTARKDGDAIRVAVHDETGVARYPSSSAGIPVGDCPACTGRLVRSGRTVVCTGCGDEFPLPDGTTVRDRRCTCGYPQIRTERGTAFELCLDRDCDHSPTLDRAVREAFDGEWDCPECSAPMIVVRRRGLLVGCERYPDCETGFRFPTGTVVGTCECGLPVFETPRERRCLDSSCQHATEASTDAPAGTGDPEVES